VQRSNNNNLANAIQRAANMTS